MRPLAQSGTVPQLFQLAQARGQRYIVLSRKRIKLTAESRDAEACGSLWIIQSWLVDAVLLQVCMTGMRSDAPFVTT